MNIDAILTKFAPKPFYLPLRFYYYKFNNRLENELLQFNKIVKPGIRAIDIGANYGFYSYVISSLFEVVEAFEPQKSCFEVIEAYSQKYQQNINAHNIALSNRQDKLDFYIPIVKGDAYTGLGSLTKLEEECITIRVPVRKLDDYQFTDVDFLKIDVEGHESSVIEGGKETILREKPTILVEIEQRHLKNKSITDIFEQILCLGYEGYFLKAKQLLPLSDFSYEKEQKPFELDLSNYKYHVNNYVNNFLFKSK